MKLSKKLKNIALSLPLILLPSAALAGLSSAGAEGSIGLFGLVFFGTMLGILTLGHASDPRENQEAPLKGMPSFKNHQAIR